MPEQGQKLTSAWLTEKAIWEVYANNALDKYFDLKSLGRPTTLSTRNNDYECIDYFLNLRDQPLATFLTANKKGGKIL